MRKIIATLLLSVAASATAQNFENQFTRSLSDVMGDVQRRFDIRLKYDMDTSTSSPYTSRRTCGR